MNDFYSKDKISIFKNNKTNEINRILKKISKA